ncbi:MAG: hypothetical protein E7299_10640 [Lachnospiraceae bacterium]|nr:hypothetical protein [Lachnospiraceae bacterium]
MYNYLNDAIGIIFTHGEQYCMCECSRSNCDVRATICGKCYKDPDAVSQKLYEDMMDKFRNILGADAKVVRRGKSLYIKLNGLYESELSTDYIGPSRAWAMKYIRENDKEKSKIIGDFLLITRTIGGHVFWPAHQIDKQNTINQVRGGAGIFDRIDITLAELKNYYETKGTNLEGKFRYYEPLYKAFQRYQWFFELFDSFPEYISKMRLDDFLHEGEVISLLDSNIEEERRKPLQEGVNYSPVDYLIYVKNCKKLIYARTNRILDLSSSREL